MTYLHRNVALRFGAQRPQAAAGRQRGRMSISGTNILDENGNKWCMRGFVYGEVGLYNDGDCAYDASIGANCVRIMFRTGGGWSGSGNSYSFPNIDGESPGQWGNTLPSYIATVEAQLVAAKRAGLKTILAFDSNCGQNGNQSVDMAAYCDLNSDGTGDNFYTAAGATKRSQHITRIQIAVRKWYGLIDFIEPVVEPNPGATGNTQTDVDTLSRDVMLAVMKEDPDMIFILGGFSYQHGKIQDPIGNVTYPTSRIVLTCDLLDSVMSGAGYASAVQDMTRGRSHQGLPVICQQAGTQISSESGPVGSATDSVLLQAGLSLLRDPNGDGSEPSIGWTFWERVSKGPNQYGPWYDQSSDGTGRVLGSANRLNVLKAALTAPAIFA